MLAVIDNSALTAEQRTYPFRAGLEDFVDTITKVMPLLTYKLDAGSLTKDWNKTTSDYDHCIYRVKVLQDGEELGSLQVNSRYKRGVGMELVYGVESFRISKERGNQNTTFTKDIKVAIRTAKKTLVGRQDDELIRHLWNHVNERLVNSLNNILGQVRYKLDLHGETMNFIHRAYEAHLAGKTEVVMPVKPISVANLDEHHARMERYHHAKALVVDFTNKKGYAIKVLDDGVIAVHGLSGNTITKYKDFESLPTEIANKFAMFKVLNVGEAYSHLGASLGDNFYYIVE